jgi:hypothetical protein
MLINTTDQITYRSHRWADAEHSSARLGSLADQVARKQFRYRGPAAQPFEWTDLAQELLAYALDEDAQRAKGSKILPQTDAAEVIKIFGYVSRDWFAGLTAERSAVTSQGVGIPVAEDQDSYERVVRDAHQWEVDRLDESATEHEADLARAEAELGKRLRAANGPVKPPGPGMRWIAQAFASERDPCFRAQRRLLGRALLGLWLDGRADDARLLVRKFRDGRKLNVTERKRLGNAIERVIRRINLDLSQEPYGRRTSAALDAGHLGDGPGSRRVLSNADARGIAQSQYDPGPGDPHGSDLSAWLTRG